MTKLDAQPATLSRHTLQDIARQVRRLAQLPGGKDRFKRAIETALQGYRARREAGREFDKERDQHFEAVAKDKRLQDEEAGPPEIGWEYEQGPVRVTPIDGGLKREERFWGWTPAKLLKRNRPELEPLIPLPGRKLSPAEELTVLMAVADLPFMENVNHSIGLETEFTAYTVWVGKVADLTSEADLILLGEFLGRAAASKAKPDPSDKAQPKKKRDDLATVAEIGVHWQQDPEMSYRALAKELGFKSHTSVKRVLERVAGKRNVDVSILIAELGKEEPPRREGGYYNSKTGDSDKWTKPPLHSDTAD